MGDKRNFEFDFFTPFSIFNYHFLECASELNGRTDAIDLEDSTANSGSDANITTFQEQEALENIGDNRKQQGRQYFLVF